jgi:hypothetical protein
VITTVHRSDGSGTTFIFTNYLSKVSKEWNDQVRFATAVDWPAGIGAKGNEGVAGNVAQTAGSIGFVEYAYAKQNNLAYTKMINKDGKDRQSGCGCIRSLGRWRYLGSSQRLWNGFERISQARPHGRLPAPPSCCLQAAAGSGGDARSAEILPVGLSERRRNGGRARLRAIPRRGEAENHSQLVPGSGLEPRQSRTLPHSWSLNISGGPSQTPAE